MFDDTGGYQIFPPLGALGRSWKCAEAAAAVQTELASRKQQKEQAELGLEKAKAVETWRPGGSSYRWPLKDGPVEIVSFPQ